MDNNKRLIILSITGVLILICGVIGVTYSWFSTIIEGTGKPIVVTSGILDIKYEETEVMNVTLGKPINDNNRATEAYKNVFTISHEDRSTLSACYSIDLSIDSIQDKFKSKWVKYELYDITNDKTVSGIRDFEEVVSTGILPIASNLTLAVDASVQYEFRIWLSYSETEDQSELLQNNSGTAISAHIKVSATSGSCKAQALYKQILADNPNVETRTDFSTIFTESNNGNTIYKASGQDGKDTYYFAGQVTNNYVKFANKYWRIVRINEDNSVRLIYAGTSASDTAAFINTSQVYNSSYNNSAYIGYMYTASEQYGTGTNSSIKTAVDNWYASNLKSYSEFISKTAIYCNDRTVASGSTWIATGSTAFNYAARVRIQTNKIPTFTCSNANDKFTASITTGNGKLIYPIGLITADEISYAGGIYGTNNSNYYIAQNALSGAQYWWTMTPNYWNSDGRVGAFIVGGSTNNGTLNFSYVSTGRGVRPVISLKACVLASGGSGTASDPYTVELADGCADVDNEILEENTVRVSATTNDTSMAIVNAPSSVIINSGSSHTFTFTVKDGYEYESVTGCNGTYDTSTNTLTVSNVTSSTTCKVNFKLLGPLYAQILEDNPNVSERTDFSTTFTASNNGNTIYRASGQDGLDTYYFAGAVTNNYVKFGTNSSGQDLWWRIVRINEDNSVRLIYAGTSASDTAAFISTRQAYNSVETNSAYVGYMYTLGEQYGTGTNSPIKTTIDNWYVSNLNSYSGYISKTAIYCNDRTVGIGTWSATGSTFRYAARTRLYTNKTPTFTCSNANDRFTASTSTGNGKLTYPIGLITADEISYAGGLWATTNSNYYIAQNASSGASLWWTMSPFDWDSYNGNASVFEVGGSYSTGNLNFNYVDGTIGVRPVISLKSCVLASGGSGTASDPYTVELPSACSSAEN